MKRARTSGGSVTGGTGDVKPQILTICSGIAGAINDYAVRQVALPVPRFGTLKNKATIIEFLSLSWYLAPEDMADTSNQAIGFLTTSSARSDGDTITVNSIGQDIIDPLTFGMVVENRLLAVDGTAATQMPITYDLTDKNGNGILIATDKIFVVGGSVGGTNAGNYTCKALYRLVNVGITEYVGIVQAQQA